MHWLSEQDLDLYRLGAQIREAWVDAWHNKRNNKNRKNKWNNIIDSNIWSQTNIEHFFVAKVLQVKIKDITVNLITQIEEFPMVCGSVHWGQRGQKFHLCSHEHHWGTVSKSDHHS